MTDELSVGEALARFRDANGLRHDEHVARRWVIKASFFTFPVPNFKWRRTAIEAHDVHHMLTGYPCTVTGEFQIAAWEFGAGRYPHWGATLFCSPLLLIGFFWSPARMLDAFRHGRRCRSLYQPLLLERLPKLSVAAVRVHMRGDSPVSIDPLASLDQG